MLNVVTKWGIVLWQNPFDRAGDCILEQRHVRASSTSTKLSRSASSALVAGSVAKVRRPYPLANQIGQRKDFETFFAEAPARHPNASKITGSICGVRIQEIEDPLMRNIRYLDKLIDELAKGRPMEKILRK